MKNLITDIRISAHDYDWVTVDLNNISRFQKGQGLRFLGDNGTEYGIVTELEEIDDTLLVKYEVL